MKHLEVGPFLVLDILFLFKLRNNRKAPMREFPVVPKFDNKKISNHYGGEDFALLMKDTK